MFTRPRHTCHTCNQHLNYRTLIPREDEVLHRSDLLPPSDTPWWLLEPADPTWILGLDEPADPTWILGLDEPADLTWILGLDEPADPTWILMLDESADPTGILGLDKPADPTVILGLEPTDLTGILGELRGQERRQPPIVKLVHWRD